MYESIEKTQYSIIETHRSISISAIRRSIVAITIRLFALDYLYDDRCKHHT